jgi:hypothetical protein
MSHTPGPWTRQFDPEEPPFNEYVIVEKFPTQPNHPNGQYIIARFPSGDSERTANASLIAAAPDLLAACEFSLSELANMTTEEFSMGGDRHARECLVAAIARAKEA